MAKMRVYMTDEGGSVAREDEGGNCSFLLRLHLLHLNSTHLLPLFSVYGGGVVADATAPYVGWHDQ